MHLSGNIYCVGQMMGQIFWLKKNKTSGSNEYLGENMPYFKLHTVCPEGLGPAELVPLRKMGVLMNGFQQVLLTFLSSKPL